MMRNSYMDTLEREYRLGFQMPLQDDDIGEALEKAIRETQVKIDQAFSKKPKFKAKLKQA
jgi:hypothetical protein